MQLLGRIPLVLLVAIAATLELVLNRIGVHLVTGAKSRHDPLFHAVDLSGLFTFYLTGLLALAAFTWAVVVQIRDRRLLRPPDRIAFTMLSALFLPMATMGLLFTLPKRVSPHLNTTFGLLLLVMVIGFMRQRAPLRPKLGVIYLAAPLLLHCYWLVTQQIPMLGPGGAYGELPSQLFVTAEHLVVVGAFAAFLFFAPFPRLVNLLEPIPVVFAVLVTSGIALLTRYQYLEVAQAAYYGLGLNLPPPSLHGVMYLAALFVLCLTLGALTMRGRQEREVALGLYLVAVSGFHLQLPYQFLLTLLGMMQIIRGSLDEAALDPEASGDRRRPATFPGQEAWKLYLQRLAAACADPAESGEAVLLQNSGQQVAHIRGRRGGVPFNLRLVRRDGLLDQLEATLGKQPKDLAPITLARRENLRGRRVSRKSKGMRIKLHLDSFDQQFELHWAADRPTDLLRENAEGVERLVHGWLGIWPGEGVHYICRPGADGWPVPLAEVVFSAEDAPVEAVAELVTLLDQIARRAEIRG